MTSMPYALRMPMPDVAARRYHLALFADNAGLDADHRPVDRAAATSLVDEYADVSRAEALVLLAELIGLAGEFEDVRCNRNSEYIWTAAGETQDAAKDRYERMIDEVLVKLVPPVAAYDGPLTPTHHLDEVPA